MKERPILFSSPMIRALLDGRKTQTRRKIKDVPIFCGDEDDTADGYAAKYIDSLRCPYGHPGDRLNVKEHAWMWCEKIPNGKTEKGRPKFKYVPLLSAPIIYCADYPKKPETDVVSEHRGNAWGWRKKLGRFLPAWASRIQLEITGVRVERLRDILHDDALAEGCLGQGWKVSDNRHPVIYPVIEYKELWESLNGEGSWAENPWVWVIEFKQIAKRHSVPTIES